MKTTTKILIGTGAGLLLLVFCFLGLVAYTGRSAHEVYELDCTALKRQPVGSVKRLVAFSPNYRQSFFQLTLRTLPAGEGEAYVEYPAELASYVRIAAQGDTLQLNVLSLDSLLEARHAVRLSGVGATLYLPDGELEEAEAAGAMQLLMERMSSRRPLLLRGDGMVNLYDSCHFANLRRAGSLSLFMSDSRVDTLALDLSEGSGWQMGGCRIGVLDLSGDRQVECDLSGTEVGRVRWHPQDGDARLRVNLGAAPASVVYEK